MEENYKKPCVCGLFLELGKVRMILTIPDLTDISNAMSKLVRERSHITE